MVFMTKWSKNAVLAGLGEQLSPIDQGIISLVAQRTRVVEEVARYKTKNSLPLLRKKIERQRRAQWIKWAREYGMDPEDASTLFNVILAIMCRVEIAVKE